MQMCNYGEEGNEYMIDGLNDEETEIYPAAVAYINFFDNEILLEVVDSPTKNWKDALQMHSSFSPHPIETLDWLGDDYEEARKEAPNGELDFAVTFLN